MTSLICYRLKEKETSKLSKVTIIMLKFMAISRLQWILDQTQNKMSIKAEEESNQIKIKMVNNS